MAQKVVYFICFQVCWIEEIKKNQSLKILNISKFNFAAFLMHCFVWFIVCSVKFILKACPSLQNQISYFKWTWFLCCFYSFCVGGLFNWAVFFLQVTQSAFGSFTYFVSEHSFYFPNFYCLLQNKMWVKHFSNRVIDNDTRLENLEKLSGYWSYILD